MVMGAGKNPTVTDLIQLGIDAKINKNTIKAIIEQTQESLQQWQVLAKNYAISQANQKLITKAIS